MVCFIKYSVLRCLLRERSPEAQKFTNFYFLIFLLFMRRLLNSSEFSGFDHISTHIWWFTSRMWYDNLFSGISSGFQILSGFSWIFFKSSHFFSFDQISLVLTTILYRIGCLLLKYDIIIFFSGSSSGFRIFPPLRI